MGKAILAFVPEDRREELIARIEFVPRGPNTITDPQAFRAELERIRAAGIAVNDEELAYGLRSIAAPIQRTRARCSRRSTSRSTARWGRWTS